MRKFLKNIDKTLVPCMIGALLVIIVFQLLGGNDALGWISSVLQVVTVALAISAWLSAKAVLNEHKKIIEKATSDVESVVLIIDIGHKNIEGQVSSYAKFKGILPTDYNLSLQSFLPDEIPKDFQVEISDRLVNVYSEKDMPTDMQGAAEYRNNFMDTISDVAKYFRHNGVKTVHLFCQSPVVLSYYVGDLLKNNFTVVVYHYTRNSSDTESYIPV